MKIIKPGLCFLVLLAYISCDVTPKNKNQKEEKKEIQPYFEGQIELSESRGYQGSLFKIYTTYHISENRIKREQKAKGLNAVFSMKNGVIIDLEKDSVTLYYSDIFQKNKHISSVQEFKNYIQSKTYHSTGFSPIDGTFTLLDAYTSRTIVKDSISIQGFTADYTLYTDDIFQQEIFDTKDIKVKRELLEIIFHQLPKEINFPLASEFKSTISKVKNDSLITKSAQFKDKISKDILQKQDTTNIDKLLNNKWLNLGIKVFKKGVDIAIHMTLKTEKIMQKSLDVSDFSIPSGDFKEMEGIDAFFDILPSGGDFDD